CTEGTLVGCDNPLLDIQARVTLEFRDKWHLKENDVVLRDGQHIPIFDELVEGFDVEYVPGGSTQNTLRVFQ
ncbi:Adenosine kinase 1, partial [Toxocara canis]